MLHGQKYLECVSQTLKAICLFLRSHSLTTSQPLQQGRGPLHKSAEELDRPLLAQLSSIWGTIYIWDIYLYISQVTA